MRRIGILGGSFNPIHNGHLLMAELARDYMRLDEVVFMPAFCSPGKAQSPHPDGNHRLNMVRLAIKGNRSFSVSDVEQKRGGMSYTIDTVCSLRGPGASLFWIIGEDHVAGLEGWKDFPLLIKRVSFVAVSRSWFNVSSSEIRRRIKQKKSIRYLTTDAVIRYINEHQLY